MPDYISLVNWTDQGARDFKDSVARADATTELAQSLGGRIRELHWTVGPYDLVAIIEAPDDETAAAVGLAIGARGSVRMTTMRAFDREAMGRIVAKTG